MVIAIAGAGGKTTVGSHIGKQLTAACRRVLFTTTTKIYMPESEAVYLGEAAHIQADAGYMVAAQGLLPGGKLEGYTPQDIAVIAALGLFDDIIVEADGAARKPVKAPGDNEPVYPACVDLIIGVVGLDCLGQPTGSEWVHRPELFRAVTGTAEGERITAQHILSLISHPDGLFRHAPEGVPKVVFLNKYDIVGDAASQQAEEIIRKSSYPVLLTGYGRNWFGEFRRRFTNHQSKGE